MDAVVRWLMDGDPAVRWQVMRDLLHAPEEECRTERARTVSEGWCARLLDLQGADGTWAGGACFPARAAGWKSWDEGQPWTATLPTLQLLWEMGVDPRAERVRAAVERVRAGCRWEHAGQPFFEGEVEPCINGRTLGIGAYFGLQMRPLVERLLREQLPDGGWNCEAENGSVRSSFATTINVLEGLLQFERGGGDVPEVAAARVRGEAYLLERHLFRRRSDGMLVKPEWLLFSFPVWWHYDVLRGLDYFRAASVVTGELPDPRLREALELVRGKRQADGRWLLENTHAGTVHFAMERDGEPSRWNTLRALRVLR